MDLDELSKLIENSVRELAKNINLEDVLKELYLQIDSKHIALRRITLEPDNFGWFIFSIGPYEIHVSEEKLNLYSHNNLVDREFKGEKVKLLYSRLVEDYNQKQIKQKVIPF